MVRGPPKHCSTGPDYRVLLGLKGVRDYRPTRIDCGITSCITQNKDVSPVLESSFTNYFNKLKAHLD